MRTLQAFADSATLIILAYTLWQPTLPTRTDTQNAHERNT